MATLQPPTTEPIAAHRSRVDQSRIHPLVAS
jgi:hypothetical protein